VKSKGIFYMLNMQHSPLWDLIMELDWTRAGTGLNSEYARFIRNEKGREFFITAARIRDFHREGAKSQTSAKSDQVWGMFPSQFSQ